MAKRIIIKGPEIPKTSGSGVKVGDQTLEEFVADEESKEMGEVLTPDSNLPGHSRRFNKSYGRYADPKEYRQPARVYTRSEINKMEWEKIMESQKTIDGVIAALLLSGREVTGRELQNNCVRQLNTTKKKYSTRSTYLFHKTDFGKFIVSRRDGKGAAYRLVPAALECKPEELLYFVHKSNVEARNTVLEHHKGLAAYLEPDVKEKKKEATEEFKKKEKSIGESALSTGLSEVISNVLGVNVNVSGRIEIVFKRE